MDKFAKDISCSVLTETSSTDPDVILEQYDTTLRTLLDQHAPLSLITKTVKIHAKVPWITTEICQARRDRRKLERRWRRTKNIDDRHLYVKAKNIANELIKFLDGT